MEKTHYKLTVTSMLLWVIDIMIRLREYLSVRHCITSTKTVIFVN